MNDLGYFSAFTLQLHKLCTGESYSAFLKRAAILFERIVFIPLWAEGVPWSVDHVFPKFDWLYETLKQKDSKIINTISNEILLTDEDLWENAFEHRRHLYFSINFRDQVGKKTFEFIKNKVFENFAGIPSVNFLVDDVEEIPWAFKEKLVGDYQILDFVFNKLHSVQGLLTDLHKIDLIEKSGFSGVGTQSISQTTTSINSFDFANLKWDQIIKLRESEFVNDYRKKMYEWAEDLQLHDATKIESIINDYIKESLFDVLSEVIPDRSYSWLSAIGANIPSPLIINPIGVYSSVSDLMKNRRLKNKFGWLFFIQQSRILHQDPNHANSADAKSRAVD